MTETHRESPPKYIGFCFGTKAIEFFASRNDAKAWTLASLSNRELYDIGDLVSKDQQISLHCSFEFALAFAKYIGKKVSSEEVEDTFYD